jgi:hypothetical protein
VRGPVRCPWGGANAGGRGRAVLEGGGHGRGIIEHGLARSNTLSAPAMPELGSPPLLGFLDFLEWESTRRAPYQFVVCRPNLLRRLHDISGRSYVKEIGLGVGPS